MSTITFTETLAVNPALEDVLRADATITTATATTFTLTNADGSYVELTGTGFQYSSGVPFTGTITAVAFYTSSGLLASGTVNSTHLGSFWSNLSSQFDPVLSALTTLFGFNTNAFNGDDSADHLTTFGSAANTLTGGGGNDVIWSRISYANALTGGTGDDTFQLSQGSNLIIHGSASDGTGGIGETDTIELAGNGTFISAAAITNIDALRFVDPGGTSQRQFQTTADQIGTGGLSLTLAVEGSATTNTESIRVTRGGSAVVDLDLSGWTFANFDANRRIELDLTNSDTNQADRIVGSSALDQIRTGGGNDELRGEAGNDDLSGGSENDTLRGGAGVDRLSGESGDDLFIYGTGEAASGETVSGGFNDFNTVRVLGDNDFTGVRFSEIDRIEFAGATGLTFDQALAWDGDMSRPAAREIVGDAGANAVVVQVAANQSFAGNALTFSNWTVGVDTLTVIGSAQNEYVTAANVRAAYDGGAGTSDFFELDRTAGDDNHTLDFSNSAAAQTLADGSTIVNFEGYNIRLGSGIDTIRGGANSNLIDGGGGNDNLVGGASFDTLEGGDDADSLDGGAEVDQLYGESGDDQLFSRLGEGTGAFAGDYINGGDGADFALVDRSDASRSINLDLGNPAQETQVGDGTRIINVERIEFRAGSGNDTLTGGALADILVGGSGRDLLSGGAGGDQLDGGDGIDLNGADTDVYAYGIFFARIQGVVAAAIDDSYFLFQ